MKRSPFVTSYVADLSLLVISCLGLGRVSWAFHSPLPFSSARNLYSPRPSGGVEANANSPLIGIIGMPAFRLGSSQESNGCNGMDWGQPNKNAIEPSVSVDIDDAREHISNMKVAPSTRQRRRYFTWPIPIVFATTVFAMSIAFVFSLPTPVDASATSPRYWDSVQSNDRSAVVKANVNLLDYAVGTMSTMYYDDSGGYRFAVGDMEGRWQALKKSGLEGRAPSTNLPAGMPVDAFSTREGAVAGLRWLVSTLDDPYSKYLTREELENERRPPPTTSHSKQNTNVGSISSGGFLGLGAIVEPARQLDEPSTAFSPTLPLPRFGTAKSNARTLTPSQARNLPTVVAVVPNSAAERAGIVVGDRIAAVGNDRLVGKSLNILSARSWETPGGYYDEKNVQSITVASPYYLEESGGGATAYRLSRVRTVSGTSKEMAMATPTSTSTATTVVRGGNSICSFELLVPGSSDSTLFELEDNDIFGQSFARQTNNEKIGYIRLTRFSRASTTGFVEAVRVLEENGASAYVVDLRNNYGGVIQESMLTASALLRDPTSVLCYTLNSRGGFVPHDALEYVTDSRYPGYLLGEESSSTVSDEVRRRSQKDLAAVFYDDGSWKPPSQYASLHEHRMWRKSMTDNNKSLLLRTTSTSSYSHARPKRLALLVNEGTASSAEVFAAALRDNGRTVALVGTPTYGKGLVQHTFPMPDGGGLRLTVAEYLTPSLRHVTHPRGRTVTASMPSNNGGVELQRSGVRPDLACETRGIPSHPGADICVGIAMDALAAAGSYGN